jgi:cyclopropane fatty-acyl-phospholipid synthase-like methyltransferase
VNKKSNTLTTKQYWESYYKNDHSSKEHIIHVCSYYDALWNQFIDEDSTNKTIIEIGGFPGRYLAYLASTYQLEPTCLDYNSDLLQIKSTFNVMNVDSYHILQEDFTIYQPKQRYDYVLSNGFIEHFEDYNAILDQHLAYLKPGGKLLIMIPNMKGYIRVYKYLVDYKNLKVHNLKCMSLNIFKNFAKRHSLEIHYLNYFGGFPFNVHQNLNFAQNIFYKVHRLLFKKKLNALVEGHPSKHFSSTIIAMFQKP